MATGKASSDTPPGKLRVVVTYLEMTAPPPQITFPPRSPTGKLAFLRAEQPTISFYRYLYGTVGGPWHWYERKGMSDAELTAIIHDPAVEIYVLYRGGVPAGFAELDRRSGMVVDLRYFGLVPDFIGLRLGPRLLGWAIDAAFAGGARRLTVNTCSLDHPKALATYQRAGFVPVRQEVKILDDPGIVPASPR
ncbi:MAG TPA: GNAT family N-acetyltransferase [Arenibaculum sp.]|nr:GNAT family N-acetyltransferase [Arenibaculum sp.]